MHKMRSFGYDAEKGRRKKLQRLYLNIFVRKLLKVGRIKLGKLTKFKEVSKKSYNISLNLLLYLS